MFARLYARFGRALAHAITKTLNIGSRHSGNLKRSQKRSDVPFDAGFVSGQSAGLLGGLSSGQDTASLAPLKI
jgi:hypothetical protein